MGDIIYSNHYIELVKEDTKVLLHVLKKGYSIQEFNTQVTANAPRVTIPKFGVLSSALKEGIHGYVEIGKFLDVLVLKVDKDKMSATATILLTEEEFEAMDKQLLLAKAVNVCKEEGIVFGLQKETFFRTMKAMTPIEIAKGLRPVDGEDAYINMYEVNDVEPTIEESGGVDHYELNVINKVLEGDWLGERIEPTEGSDGKDIYGLKIAAKPGLQKALLFDPNTVISIIDEVQGKTTLKALRNGAVVFEGEMVMVLNAVYIDGDVGVATGNIEFDGYVEVSGTVEDNFTIVATGNIQVLGDMGVGAVQLIESTEGDIYIRGGIAGKNKAHIKTNKNLYTKFASDAVIECGGKVDVGFYTMNCDIRAKEVVLEKSDSKVIGGCIEADVKVIAGELGSRAGVQTKIKINGFDRQQVEEDYGRLGTAIELTKERIKIADDELKVYDKKVIKECDYVLYENLRQKDLKYSNQLKGLYEAQKNYISYLHAKGNGEIIATKGVHSNVFIEMGDDKYLTKTEQMLSMHYYYMDNEIKGIDN